MDIVGAEKVVLDRSVPECHVIARCLRDEPDDYAFDVLTRIVREAVFREHSDGVFVGELGGVHHAFRPLFDPKGSRTLTTAEGPRRYEESYFVDVPDGFVSVGLRVRRPDGSLCGNVQHVLLPREQVERVLRRSGLDGEFRRNDRGRLEFSGDREAIRRYEVYPHCNGLTWGLYTYHRAVDNSRAIERWSGAYFPDEATAREYGQRWVDDREKVRCANLTDLRNLFPDHPVVRQVERWEEMA